MNEAKPIRNYKKDCKKCGKIFDHVEMIDSKNYRIEKCNDCGGELGEVYNTNSNWKKYDEEIADDERSEFLDGIHWVCKICGWVVPGELLDYHNPRKCLQCDGTDLVKVIDYVDEKEKKEKEQYERDHR